MQPVTQILTPGRMRDERGNIAPRLRFGRRGDHARVDDNDVRIFKGVNNAVAMAGKKRPESGHFLLVGAAPYGLEKYGRHAEASLTPAVGHGGMIARDG